MPYGQVTRHCVADASINGSMIMDQSFSLGSIIGQNENHYE